ncbi:hypothetical protein EW146_g4784 [Bondarzewia mesenterica]|uniref:GATA-type domain-containing protein n=1 Tax=Bondarzewia mesenterica TaxID=1095465 RepID=A0A4S4LTJ0_9AGAM|nr:hypothetical protein EW146_g4784 [Bondarzewia mesenterica]
MSSYSYHDRSHISGPASSSSSRHSQNPAASSARQASYSSLNEALGGPDRQVEPTYPQSYHAAAEPSHSQMSSDGRYMYQHQPGQGVTYDYAAAYPTTSYDAPPPPPFPQNPARPQRSASAQSHSPPQQSPYNPSPSPYHYGSSSYPAQWNGESWSQYPQSFVPAPVQDQSVMSGPGRPDVAPPPPPAGVQRVFIPPQQQASPESHRSAETPTLAEAPPQIKRVKRDKEPATRQESPTSTLGLDFLKAHSYRVLIDTTTALSNDISTSQSRTPPADAIHRMMQAAVFGSQMLGGIPGPPVQTTTPAPDPQPTASMGGGTEDGEGSPRTLCNACGLVYAKLIKKRNRDAARKGGAIGARGRTHTGSAPPDDGLPSSGEEDEDSYASQDFRSEVDDRGGRS